MYEIAKQVIQLDPGTGVDRVCQMLLELTATQRSMERITIFHDRLEVNWYVDPENEEPEFEEGSPSSIESMLANVQMAELRFDRDKDTDPLRLTYRMCRKLMASNIVPITWIVGDLDQLKFGLEQSGMGMDAFSMPHHLYGLPVLVSAQLGYDRIVVVGGASKHHNPERATHAVSAFMPWAERKI